MKRISLFALVVMFCLFSIPAAMAADTIPVGVPIPMTGWAAGSGSDYFKGIKMAIDEINASGGLLGKQLEIIRFDSKGFEPEVVMQAADYLCGQKNVASVHAGWAGWGQDVRAYGKYDAPFFADDGSQAAVDVFKEDPEKYSNIYQLTDVGVEQAKSMFRALMALPYKYPNKKVVIINTDDSWGLEVGDTLEKSFKQSGWDVKKRETVPYGTNEWGVILSQIRRIKPALIHMEIPSGQENITCHHQPRLGHYAARGGGRPGDVCRRYCGRDAQRAAGTQGAKCRRAGLGGQICQNQQTSGPGWGLDCLYGG